MCLLFKFRKICRHVYLILASFRETQPDLCFYYLYLEKDADLFRYLLHLTRLRQSVYLLFKFRERCRQVYLILASFR